MGSDNSHRLIIIDSLHSWAEAAFPDLTEYESLNAGLSFLREIAGRLDCPVLAVAERNRASMSSGGLSAGAGSRKIEYGASSVIDLDLDKDAIENANGEKAMTFRLAKNRNGSPTRPKVLMFHGAFQRFRGSDIDES